MTALNSAGTVAIDRGYHWRPIDEMTPRGCKLQLVCERDGVAAYGVLATVNFHWTHWAPVPTFRKE